MRYDSITDAIGNTPLVRIDPAVHGLRNIDLYAKLEMLNPFGSVKDRPAWHMARPHLESAAEGEGTVVELSSGNTAKALALLAGMHGLKFKSVTNRMRVPEIKELLLLLGAEIEELPGRSECLDPTDTDDPLTHFHQALTEPGSTYLHTDQYFNPRNVEAHAAGTGPEIVKDLDGRAPDWFVACVGTAGSSTGVARVLREHDPDVRVLGLVAHKSDFIPGIRTIDEVHQVGLFDPATYDTIESVTSGEAIDGMLTLIRRCGLLSGPTGGAAYQGAVRHLRDADEALEGTGRRETAVFIVCDRAESYLSYVRARRPELLGRTSRVPTLATLTEDDVRTDARSVGVDDARRWIAEGDPRPLVVDMRSPHAYAALHIEGSVNIVDELFEELVRGGLPFSKRTPVLLACPVGEKSLRHAALLTRMGHPDVRSLAGGIVAWRDAGAPLVRE
ncbi:pyridoxal-5'-phosphate-dependent protein subunit beta [Streptomyces sp. Alain-F2R5]|jgi:cysteine synthase/rhodanese-related sulfurtransferase|uniref:pyridoxal-phosphate dependent enzyme n=1 Tax=Streptomyces mutabilis TaxID=67332 RepID=UPI000A22EE60|nr:pyridoxal-phosphate dependent enzyme [Streptomyces sp. Alain-F2R5]MDG9690104.1 pyridoxal-phosphate dependent enzyme [Streptomyces sp. DH17]OSC65076.1 pyridoxal-5'-phosphate-dependent protein subunit beta [Streptomyces sp. 4F]PAN03348.1 pyridoxal-5'-phosphate-dependent protein subunit beta [Streptomyces sp. Alain-F2R5]